MLAAAPVALDHFLSSLSLSPALIVAVATEALVVAVADLADSATVLALIRVEVPAAALNAILDVPVSCALLRALIIRVRPEYGEREVEDIAGVHGCCRGRRAGPCRRSCSCSAGPRRHGSS